MRPFSGCDYVKPIGGCVNRAFGDMEPWQVAAITATTVLGGVWIWKQVSEDESKSQFPLGASVPVFSIYIKPNCRKC